MVIFGAPESFTIFPKNGVWRYRYLKIPKYYPNRAIPHLQDIDKILKNTRNERSLNPTLPNITAS